MSPWIPGSPALIPHQTAVGRNQTIISKLCNQSFLQTEGSEIQLSDNVKEPKFIGYGYNIGHKLLFK